MEAQVVQSGAGAEASLTMGKGFNHASGHESLLKPGAASAAKEMTAGTTGEAQYSRLFGAISLLHSNGLLPDTERTLFKDLVVRANAHALSVMSAAVNVCEATLKHRPGAKREALAELYDTMKVVLDTSFMM